MPPQSDSDRPHFHVARKYRSYGFLVGALAFTCLVPVGAFIEAGAHGPYTVRFNQQMKADAQQLVGKPCSAVEQNMGRADVAYEHPEAVIAGNDGSSRIVGSAGTTLEYYPYPMIPVARFQVFCSEGTVAGLEMFDD